MTKQEAVEKLLTWWRSQLYYHEGANNWTKYAEDADLAKLYGWKPQNQPWCDIVYDDGMIACFGLQAASELTFQPIGKGSALCRTSAQYYKNNNAWYASPEPGDQVFFFDENKEINHTGIVEKVSGGVVHCMEGNRSDQVGRSAYAAGTSIIAGYGRPKWSTVAKNATTDQAEIPVEDKKDEKADGGTYTLTYHVLRYGAGMKGQEHLRKEVRAMQQNLKGLGFDLGPDGCDGEYGNNTKKAVTRYQRSVRITADGEFGPDTRATMTGVSVK